LVTDTRPQGQDRAEESGQPPAGSQYTAEIGLRARLLGGVLIVGLVFPFVFELMLGDPVWSRVIRTILWTATLLFAGYSYLKFPLYSASRISVQELRSGLVITTPILGVFPFRTIPIRAVSDPFIDLDGDRVLAVILADETVCTLSPIDAEIDVYWPRNAHARSLGLNGTRNEYGARDWVGRDELQDLPLRLVRYLADHAGDNTVQWSEIPAELGVVFDLSVDGLTRYLRQAMDRGWVQIAWREDVPANFRLLDEGVVELTRDLNGNGVFQINYVNTVSGGTVNFSQNNSDALSSDQDASIREFVSELRGLLDGYVIDRGARQEAYAALNRIEWELDGPSPSRKTLRELTKSARAITEQAVGGAVGTAIAGLVAWLCR
jgi:hypothetical protein